MKTLKIMTSLILLISSCVPNRDTTSTMNRFLINNTGKTVIQELENDNGSFVLISNGKDTSKVVLSRKGIILGGLVFGFSTINIIPIYVTKETTFCINDTSKYEYNKMYSIEGYSIPIDKTDSLYFKCYEINLKSNDIYNPESNFIFHYTDALNPIMKKDYTMLNKFKDYYKK